MGGSAGPASAGLGGVSPQGYLVLGWGWSCFLGKLSLISVPFRSWRFLGGQTWAGLSRWASCRRMGQGRGTLL